MLPRAGIFRDACGRVVANAMAEPVQSQGQTLVFGGAATATGRRRRFPLDARGAKEDIHLLADAHERLRRAEPRIEVPTLQLTARVVVAGIAVALVLAGAAGGATVLLGDQTIEPKSDSNSAGQAEAYRSTASASGTLNRVSLYIDTGSTATKVTVGVYTDSGGHPGTLLAQGSLTSPVAGAWNNIALPGSVSITAATNYWIALLGTGGTIRYRDRCCGGGGSLPAETNAQTSLTSLPATWTTGTGYTDGPLSAYASSDVVGPVLSVSPNSLSFGAIQGGANPAPAQLTVTNSGSGALAFTAAPDVTWLTVSPTSGSTPQTVTVTASAAGLAVGSYQGHVTITASGAQGSPASIPVTFTISSPGSTSDWLTIEGAPGRGGNAASETAISPSNAPNLTLSWSAAVDGKVTAQPLFVKSAVVGGATHDVLVVATSANSVYALDANSGAVLWRRAFGSQSSNCAIPGGYGVTGAPVVDRTNNRVYAVADDGSLRTLSLADGTDTVAALQVIALPATNKVWGGLNLVGSNLYIATASDGCDTAPWRGTIYRIDVSGGAPRVAGSFVVVPGVAAPNGGGGIWGYGGVSVDTATGRVFAASGADSNEAFTPYADRMIALDSSLGVLGSFEPPHPNNFPCASPPCDLDFGSTPLVFTPTGCPTLVAAGSKDGNLYLLRENDLAASAPPLQTLQLNGANDWLGSGGVGGVPAFWPAGQMVFVTDAGAGITGAAGGMIGLTVQANCTLAVSWSAAVGGNAQPNSTPTIANGVVFVGEGNGGRVDAFNAQTGSLLWRSAVPTAGATYAAPMVAAGKLFAGSWNGFNAADTGTVRAWVPSAAALTVSISAPADGSTVSGSSVTVTASPSANAVGVQLKVDGNNLGAELTSAPWSRTWDTTTVANGNHVLTAVARDAASNTVTSAPVTVNVQNGSPPPTKVLLGDQTVEPQGDSNSAGQAEAYRSTASAAGTLSKVSLYVNMGSAATKLVVGVYTDSSGHPGTLLAQGSLTSPVAGAWNDVALPGGSIASGTNYWIALLGTGGTIRYRDRCCGGGGTLPAETSTQTTLTALPATWSTGTRYTDGPLSAYGSGS
jgi:outer membrane protein assembly factor BamB